jgi:hypothetical protein
VWAGVRRGSETAGGPGSPASVRLVSPWSETTGGLQVLECEGEGVLSAYGDALGAGLLLAAVSQLLPGSGQVGSAHSQAGPAAGNVGEPQWRQGGFDCAGQDGGGTCLPPVGEDVDRNVKAMREDGPVVISKALLHGVPEPGSRSVGVA